MSKQRLTRDESRALTRERLVTAAAQVIADKGYASASVEDIAEAAGYSRGAFYSNFGGKDGLFLELLHSVADAKRSAVHAIFAEGSSPDELLRKLGDFYAKVCLHKQDFMLWSEAKMLAARDPEFRAGLVELERENRMEITGFVRRYYEGAGIAPPAPPAHIALGLTALSDGMAFTQMLDPETADAETTAAVLDYFFGAATHAHP